MDDTAEPACAVTISEFASVMAVSLFVITKIFWYHDRPQLRDVFGDLKAGLAIVLLWAICTVVVGLVFSMLLAMRRMIDVRLTEVSHDPI